MSDTKSCMWCKRHLDHNEMLYLEEPNDRTKAKWFCDWVCLARYAETEAGE